MTRPEPLASVDLRHDESVVLARQRARDVAELLGFDRGEQTRIATAVSELARNAHRYAGGGRMTVTRDGRDLRIEVADQGPGIADLDEILSGRYVSRTGMGLGLIGVRRLMDDVKIESRPGRGTRVEMRKALPPEHPTPPAHEIRDAIARRVSRNPYDEVTQQNLELLQALSEVRARQDELVALNRELDDTNRGVVALYAELDDRADLLRDADERKSRFLADMSHELRTPLNSIVALTGLLLDGQSPLEAEQVKQVQFIRRMADDQLRLVGDLLDIAKIEAGRVDVEWRMVSVPELFSILRSQLRPLVPDGGTELRFDAVGELPPLRTDEPKLVQVLRNLVTNALKFTPEGEVVVRAEVDGPDMVFRVADTGIGIAPDDLPRVFEEFVQIPGELQREQTGTGLGLPLCRKLAGILGGTLDVESAVGRGSMFTVRFPLVAGEERPAAESLVLVVDDDEAARYVVRTHLRDSGWEVAEAAGGFEALEIARRAHPAAIVLDLSMPDLDGLGVLEQLRADPALATIAVVVHSSQSLDDERRTRLLELGAQILDKATTSRNALLAALGTSAAPGGEDG